MIWPDPARRQRLRAYLKPPHRTNKNLPPDSIPHLILKTTLIGTDAFDSLRARRLANIFLCADKNNGSLHSPAYSFTVGVPASMPVIVYRSRLNYLRNVDSDSRSFDLFDDRSCDAKRLCNFSPKTFRQAVRANHLQRPPVSSHCHPQLHQPCIFATKMGCAGCGGESTRHGNTHW